MLIKKLSEGFSRRISTICRFSAKLRQLGESEPIFLWFVARFADKSYLEMQDLAAPLITRYLKIYSAAVCIYAAAYLIPSMSFQTGDEPARLSIVDALYFSVVTITSLGYGDIVPKSAPIKILAITQAIIGLILVGMFFLELSIKIGRRYQEKYEQIELARLDRQQFKTYVAVVHRLTQYIDSKASEHLRQAQRYDWTYYYFGDKVMSIPPSFMDSDNFRGLGPYEDIPPSVNQVNDWKMELNKLSEDLRALVLDSIPVIFDENILKQYDYITRLLMTAIQDLQVIRSEESGEFVIDKVKRNCVIVSAVISKLRAFRKLFTDKATRKQDGGSYRYREIHDRLSDSELPY